MTTQFVLTNNEIQNSAREHRAQISEPSINLYQLDEIFHLPGVNKNPGESTTIPWNHYSFRHSPAL